MAGDSTESSLGISEEPVSIDLFPEIIGAYPDKCSAVVCDGMVVGIDFTEEQACDIGLLVGGKYSVFDETLPMRYSFARASEPSWDRSDLYVAGEDGWKLFSGVRGVTCGEFARRLFIGTRRPEFLGGLCARDMIDRCDSCGELHGGIQGLACGCGPSETHALDNSAGMAV